MKRSEIRLSSSIFSITFSTLSSKPSPLAAKGMWEIVQFRHNCVPPKRCLLLQACASDEHERITQMAKLSAVCVTAIPTMPRDQTSAKHISTRTCLRRTCHLDSWCKTEISHAVHATQHDMQKRAAILSFNETVANHSPPLSTCPACALMCPYISYLV